MRQSLFLALLFSLATVGTAKADPLPFERGSWAKLRAAHAGQPTVIHFWGLTCAPCLVEMPQWAALKNARRGTLTLSRRAAPTCPCAASPTPPNDRFRCRLRERSRIPALPPA